MKEDWGKGRCGVIHSSPGVTGIIPAFNMKYSNTNPMVIISMTN